MVNKEQTSFWPPYRGKVEWETNVFPQGLIMGHIFVFQLVQDLLKSLPSLFEKTMETQSALGSALQAAFKLLSPTGGRMTVFQTQLPNLGVGALQSREDPNQRASAKVRAVVFDVIRQDCTAVCSGFRNWSIINQPKVKYTKHYSHCLFWHFHWNWRQIFFFLTALKKHHQQAQLV